MPVYDCRKDGREPGSISFPCNVRIVNPANGERITNVFYASTSPARIARYILGPDGTPLVHPQQRKRWVDNGRGGKKIEIYHDRLEEWEYRRWIALAIDTNQVIAKSEDSSEQ